MNKIIECIIEYINLNKELSIKGLGKFSLIEKEAEIHPILMEFKPPAAEIIFEHNLKTDNENNFIEFCRSKLENLEPEIETLINEFANQVNNDLESANLAVVKSFAIFEKDMTKGVVLKLSESSNFNLQNYGLPEFKLNPEGATNKGIKAKKTEAKTRKRKKLPLFIKVLLIILTIFGGAYSGLYFTNNIDKANSFIEEKIANLNKSKTKTDEINSEDKIKEEFPKENILKDVEPEIAQPQIDEKSGITEEIKVLEEKSNLRKKYYVVDNIFRNEDLAQRRVETLKQEGFNSEIAGQTRQGLHIVVYNGFADKQLAEQELSKIRQNVNKDAWMYIK